MSDIHTAIANVAKHNANDGTYTVYSDDTDILCLLIHHIYHGSNPQDT